MRRLTCSVLFPFFFFIVHAQAQHTLRGLVTDQKGAPLEGANIWMPEVAKGSAADSSGQFALHDLPPGSYTLSISHLGYALWSQKVQIPQQGELQIALEAFFYQVDALVVQGTRASRHMPMTFLNLDKKELQVHNLGQDLPFLLQWTPSVVVTSD
ncbi:MAG: carboxypeptidase-like regulatory domain-containing protein, partial [Haliscomenobacter sp.]